MRGGRSGALGYNAAVRFPDHVGLALLWRYLCHSLMLGLTLLAEPRPAPQLYDLVLARVPRLEWVASNNYTLWLLAYVPVALWLWRAERRAFLHFLYVGGLLSLLRGFCVPLTGLGPVDGLDVNAGLAPAALWGAWWDLVNPFSALGGAAEVHLTKDLFFSGHTATTFLLWLYCRGRGALASAALAAHLFVVAVVLLAHLHYSIDVVGAWAVTFSLFVVCERRVRVGGEA